MDRLVGFQDLGAKDDFSTTKLENLLVKKGRASLSFLDFATYSLQLLSLNQFFFSQECLAKRRRRKMRKITSIKKAYVGPLGLQRMSTLIQIDLEDVLMADLQGFLYFVFAAFLF